MDLAPTRSCGTSVPISMSPACWRKHPICKRDPSHILSASHRKALPSLRKLVRCPHFMGKRRQRGFLLLVTAFAADSTRLEQASRQRWPREGKATRAMVCRSKVFFFAQSTEEFPRPLRWRVSRCARCRLRGSAADELFWLLGGAGRGTWFWATTCEWRPSGSTSLWECRATLSRRSTGLHASSIRGPSWWSAPLTPLGRTPIYVDPHLRLRNSTRLHRSGMPAPTTWQSRWGRASVSVIAASDRRTSQPGNRIGMA